MSASRALSAMLVCALGLTTACTERSVEEVRAAAAVLEEPDSGFKLHWPFRDGEEGVAMYQTYGQAEGHGSINIHQGLDIHAPAGTPIYAPVSGTVAAMFQEGQKPWVKGFAIRTVVDDHEYFTQLLHLEESSMQFSLGDTVEVGDFVGELAVWPKDGGYLPHLHLGIGDGKLQAFNNGPNAGNAALLFYYTGNPLQYLVRERDEMPPQLVPFDSGAPFVFRVVTEGSDGTWKASKDKADPQALSGMLDIEVHVRDAVPPGKDFSLAPRSVRIEIEPVDDAKKSFGRKLVFEGTISQANQFPYSAYIEPSQGPGDDARYVYHYMAMAPLDWDANQLANPTPLDTSKLEPGEYRVKAHASDMDNTVLLGEMTVRIVGAGGR